MAFDAHHGRQHLPATRPQTPERHLQGVLWKETRQQPAPPRFLLLFTVSVLSPCVSAAPDPQTEPVPAPCPSPRRGAWPCRCQEEVAAVVRRRRRGFRGRGRRSSSRRRRRCPRARCPRLGSSIELRENKQQKESQLNSEVIYSEFHQNQEPNQKYDQSF